MQDQLVIHFSEGPRGALALDHRVGSDVGAYLVGQPVEKALDVLPRLFNLCRHAQRLAVECAFDVPISVSKEALNQERLRDGLAKLFVLWPQAMEQESKPVPSFEDDPRQLRARLFGPSGSLPLDGDYQTWLQSGTHCSELGCAILALFQSGEGVSAVEDFHPDRALARAPMENSAASRHSDHPVMQAVHLRHGRGPLWRFFGLLLEVEDALSGGSHAPFTREDGTAIVAAPRGMYAVKAQAIDGKVTGFERRTPTDHMVAKGGALDESLGSLRKITAKKVRLVTAMIDPCIPVTFQEQVHA